MRKSSQEFDMNLIQKLLENGLPLTDMGLIALLDMQLPPKLMLSLVGEYVSGATELSRFVSIE